VVCPSIADCGNSSQSQYLLALSLGINCFPKPCDDEVTKFIKALQRRDTQLDKLNYIDKGQGTYLDSYSERQFRELCIEVWKASGDPKQSRIQVTCYLRTLLDHLLGHFLLARGEDRRAAEISDIHTFEFPDQGVTRCYPLIMTMRGSKTNQFGRLETMGAFRNKDPFICAMGALGYYLLFRWDLTEEEFPDFTDRPRWYNIRLLLSAKPTQKGVTKKMAYSTQLDWTTKIFQLINLNTTKKTHLFRASGAKLAELKGVTEEQIKRAGRWNHDQMMGCYLTSLPLPYMRRMGGHPSQSGCFEVQRAKIKPPPELLSLIWPKLDQWKGRFGKEDGQIDDLAAGRQVSLS
jgi:hypothetical protein